MMQIPLSAVPSQSLTIEIDQSTYLISLKSRYDGVVALSISRDQILLLSGQILISDTLLIPYKYLQTGNFVFTVFDEELPDYTKFGIEQFLIYVSPIELQALQSQPIPLER